MIVSLKLFLHSFIFPNFNKLFATENRNIKRTKQVKLQEELDISIKTKIEGSVCVCREAVV